MPSQTPSFPIAPLYAWVRMTNEAEFEHQETLDMIGSMEKSLKSFTNIWNHAMTAHEFSVPDRVEIKDVLGALRRMYQLIKEVQPFYADLELIKFVVKLMTDCCFAARD